MRSAPCQDCKDRKLLCHDSCEKYQAYKDEREAYCKARSTHRVVLSYPVKKRENLVFTMKHNRKTIDHYDGVRATKHPHR